MVCQTWLLLYVDKTINNGKLTPTARNPAHTRQIQPTHGKLSRTVFPGICRSTSGAWPINIVENLSPPIRIWALNQIGFGNWAGTPNASLGGEGPTPAMESPDSSVQRSKAATLHFPLLRHPNYPGSKEFPKQPELEGPKKGTLGAREGRSRFGVDQFQV